jgi:CDP-diacylglycerol---glycerol-3-phosphate 3-phosphatidyltransferase
VGEPSMHIMSFDLIYTLVLIAIVTLVAIAYGVRLAIKGRARFDRVDRQGGSPLLGKGVMEMAYWCMQPVARLLVFFHITPNKLSWASLVFGALAGACLAVGHFGFGAAFATISALLDSLDGMVARLTGVASDAGEVLDAAVDRYVEFFFLGGLVIYYREIPVFQLLALLAMIGSFMVSYSTAKAEALQIDPPKSAMRRPERAVYLTLGAALCPVTIPWFEVYREFSIPIGHPMIMALCLVAVIANVSAIERFWAIAKAIRVRERDQAEARRQAALLAAEAEGQSDSSETPHPLKAR